MSIERVGANLVDLPGLVPVAGAIFPNLGIESARLDECVAEFGRGAYRGVFGAPCYGFHETNLDFLSRMPQACSAWFWDVKLASVEGLYALRDLLACGVNPPVSGPPQPGIDFSRFQKLESLTTHWNRRDSGWERSNVRRFYLWHYNPREKRFTGLRLPLRTEYLELNWLNPASLAGLAPLPHLTELEIHRGRNLTDLSLLPSFAPRLRKLIVTTCGRLTSAEGIANHPTLALAIVNGVRLRG